VKISLYTRHSHIVCLGLSELDNVLTPKPTGFEVSYVTDSVCAPLTRNNPFSLQLALEHIGSHFDAVYDVTIFYEGMDRRRTGRAPPPHLFSMSCSFDLCGSCVVVICWCWIPLLKTPLGQGKMSVLGRFPHFRVGFHWKEHSWAISLLGRWPCFRDGSF